MGICRQPHPTRWGDEVLGFYTFTSHSRIGSQVHFSLHPAHGEEERQHGGARGAWEKLVEVGTVPTGMQQSLRDPGSHPHPLQLWKWRISHLLF